MFSISSSQPAIWSPAPSPVIAAVAAAAPASPVQALSRDAQAGSNPSGRDPGAAARLARAGSPSPERTAERSAERPGERKAAARADAAPLLPREAPEGSEEQATTEQAQAAQDQDAQARLAEEKAIQQQLQDVISNVWKASAAVVDLALNREAAVGESERSGQVAPAAAANAVAGLPVDSQPSGRADAANDDVAEPAELADLRASQEVVGYDEQGHSSLAPLEAGSLISRRV